MINITIKKDCCGCNACVQRCPKKCIAMQEDSEGFLYPKVDESLCIDCGLCEKVCPVINQAEARKPLMVYAAKNPNEEIRMRSSSGGIFTMLAERVIANGGVVFGARFNEEWEVVHDYTETIEGLVAFRGSKYLQSRIGKTFRQAETFLKQGREVLFSGTPCQIAGLKHFLRKEYDNLLAVDVICYGAPSPKIWQEYLKENICKLKIEKSDITDISFRDKSTGWSSYSFFIAYNKDNVPATHKELACKNLFMRGFLADLYLRPSCYACPVKDLKSWSDITLGDYWGIGQTMPSLDDNKGVSVIMVNTTRSVSQLQSIGMELHIADYEDVRQKNPAICRPARMPQKRIEFWHNTDDGFHTRITRLFKEPLKVQLGKQAKMTLRSILLSVGILDVIKNIGTNENRCNHFE